MRHTSKKRARLNRAVKPLRDEYRWEFPKCQVPWCQAPAVEIHEIARGCHRNGALGERCAWLALCRFDHGQMDCTPIALQLAIKLVSDPSGYDREKVNALRGRAANAVSAEDVHFWVKQIQAANENDSNGLRKLVGS